MLTSIPEIPESRKREIELSASNSWKVMNSIWKLGNRSLDPKKQRAVRFIDIVNHFRLSEDQGGFGELRWAKETLHRCLRKLQVNGWIRKVSVGMIKKTRRVRALQTHTFTEEVSAKGSFWLLTAQSLRCFGRYKIWAPPQHIEKKLMEFGYLKEKPTEVKGAQTVTIKNEKFKEDSKKLAEKLIYHRIFETVLANDLADYFKKYANLVIKKRVESGLLKGSRIIYSVHYQ